MEKISTNIKNGKLQNSFSDILLDGKIQIASNRGYLSNKRKPQQDAIGCAIKNEHCFLNIVADGIGGTSLGEKASGKIVEDLTKWFLETDENTINDSALISILLQKKVDEINNELYKLYKGKALTTFVLSITTEDTTIIANVGDSTAYEYDEEYDCVHQLTTLDSWADIYFKYEDIRSSSWNSIVTAGIGDFYRDQIHINIIENCGRKIILSTDGVTDLINEKTFTSYFLKEVSADEIVDDALYHPDVEYLDKKEDNISVAIIKLPGLQKDKEAKKKAKTYHLFKNGD